MPGDRARAELERMVATLRHESFYNTGTWIDESLGLYVGWCAQTNSFSDGMPLYNERRDKVLVFSGEEFPDPGTAQRLKARGHELTDDEPNYLIHQCEEDPSFPAGLNGRFHGLFVDRAQREATLFNDRYGMHRLNYRESKEAFYFGVEAKAILAVRPETRALDFRGVGEFISCGCVLENRTLFHGVHALPGASLWTFRDGRLARKASYFEPREWEDQSLLEPDAYYRELRDVFERNLPRYFEGRQPIAMSLTGGLDTRMIMAAHRCAPGSLPCYTWGGTFRDNQDVVVARKVARVVNQPHDVIAAGKDFLSRFSHYAERSVYLTDGCAGVNHAPDLYVNTLARAVAPVRMTGLYGGEVLRRVRAFKPEDPLPGIFQPELVTQIRATTATYAENAGGHPLSFAVFRQAPWHHHPSLSIEETQLTVRSPYLDNDFVRTVFRAPGAACLSNEVSLRLIADRDERLGRIPTDRGIGGTRGRLLERLSHGFLEFLFKAEYAYDYGMPQALARVDHLLSPLSIERIFLGRHKAFHFRVWYRDSVAEYVRAVLLDPTSLARPYIKRHTVEAIVNKHLKGYGNYTTEIHKLLSLELIHRLFVDVGPERAAARILAKDSTMVSA
jgi:asparagine synthase (glutamine-hydrolysing)